MSIFLSYAHTGANQVDVKRRMQAIYNTLGIRSSVLVEERGES